MAPTNRLTDGGFDGNGSAWTTDDPTADATRTYTFSSGALKTTGTGTGSISQQINVTAGEELLITVRGCSNSTGMAQAVGIYNGATYRYATDGVHAAPLDWEWPIRSEWRGWRVVVPAGWTTAKVFFKFPSGTVWVQEVGCYTSPDLVLDGDFSTNTDGSTGGDGGTPQGWTLDWYLVSGAGSGWTTYGGALKHTNNSASWAASQAFAVTAGELLFVSALAWGGNSASLRIYWGDNSTFTQAAALDWDTVGDGVTTVAADELWERAVVSGWVTVPVGATYARAAVYSATATNTMLWDKVSVRRCSTVDQPDVRVEVNLGGLSGSLERPGYTGNWIVGDTGGWNEVGTTFMSSWEGGDFGQLAWTDVTSLTHDVSIRRGRRSSTDTYETGSATFTFDNSDRRFDPLWTHDDNPYARASVCYWQAGRPIRVSLIDPDTTEPTPIFTGRVRRIDPQWAYPSDAWCQVDASEDYTTLNVPVSETTFASAVADVFLGTLLDAVGWSESQRRIDAGLYTLPAVTESGSLLGFMRGVAVREFARFLIDGAGRARYIRSLYRQTTSQATIDPNSTVGAWGLDPDDLRLTYDQTMLRNRVKAIRYGGTEADSQVATDDASRDQYGTQSYEVTDLLVASNATALEWAETELARHSSPVARIDSVTVRPDVNSAWWALLLWAEFGDQFTARAYPPPNGSATVEQAVTFEAVEWEIRPLAENGWRVVWQFVPYSA